MKQKLKDGWVNVLKGLGGSKDKVTCSEFVADVLGYSKPEKYSPQDVFNKIKG